MCAGNSIQQQYGVNMYLYWAWVIFYQISPISLFVDTDVSTSLWTEITFQLLGTESTGKTRIVTEQTSPISLTLCKTVKLSGNKKSLEKQLLTQSTSVMWSIFFLLLKCMWKSELCICLSSSIYILCGTGKMNITRQYGKCWFEFTHHFIIKISYNRWCIVIMSFNARLDFNGHDLFPPI